MPPLNQIYAILNTKYTISSIQYVHHPNTEYQRQYQFKPYNNTKLTKETPKAYNETTLAPNLQL